MAKEINILGDITSMPYFDTDVSLQRIKAELDTANGQDLVININSYGGEVFEAVGIASLFASYNGAKVFNILGICASAATMLFNANDVVNVASGAMIMYHKPLQAIFGNANDFRKTIEVLDKIENENIVRNLIARTGKQDNEIRELISNEWWLTSDEAINTLKFTAKSNTAVFNKEKTKQLDIYKNFIEKRKALNSKSDVYANFIHYKNLLKA